MFNGLTPVAVGFVLFFALSGYHPQYLKGVSQPHFAPFCAYVFVCVYSYAHLCVCAMLILWMSLLLAFVAAAVVAAVVICIIIMTTLALLPPSSSSCVIFFCFLVS